MTQMANNSNTQNMISQFYSSFFNHQKDSSTDSQQQYRVVESKNLFADKT